MAGPCAISRLFAGLHPGGRFRVAKPRARTWSPRGHTRGRNRDSHLSGWYPDLAHVARGLSGGDLPGEALGWSLPGAHTSEARRGHKTRLAAGLAGGPVDPHHRRVHSIFRWPGSLDCSLPGIGSVRLADLSGFAIGHGKLKKP